MVYALTLVSALVLAVGEVVQQRSAAHAPPEYNLSPRLLLWLVRRPRWLAGVACAAVGNSVFAVALTQGSVVLIEAVFVIRLIFALVVGALWARHRIPLREVLGAAAITAGLTAFLLAGQPSEGGEVQVPDLHWAIGGGAVVVVVALLTAIATRMRPIGKAALLGSGAGLLFGLQASLMQGATAVLVGSGPVALLRTWEGYAVVVVALSGMLLIQSAFEAADIEASYPAVVTGQLLCAIVIGTWVLGGSLNLAPGALAVLLPALLLIIVGIYQLASSPIVGSRPVGEGSSRSGR